MSKAELRAQMLAARREIPRSSVGEMSNAVRQNLFGLAEFAAARRIASYVAKEDEVQTVPIIERAFAEGKSVAVPRVERAIDDLLFFEIKSIGELSPGGFGILEPNAAGRPVGLSETDAVLVPLVAWDERGYRIGHGRGYYDRALSKRGNSVAIGLAFESQRVSHIPETTSDVKLDLLVTEKRVLRFDGIRVSLR